jgi:F-type H+-transporting ATPase subunit delta
MDVTEEQIARVYAQAFMGVAKNTADPTPLVDEVGSIVDDVLQNYPKFEQTLQSELVSPEDKAQMLDRVFRDRVSSQVLNFLKVLAGHGRLVLLRPIARILKKLDAERRGRFDVELRVALPVDASIENEIENRIRRRFGGEPVIRVVVDPSLIAGVIVRFGDRVFDGSIHTQLEHTRRAMIDRATDSIELNADRFQSA